MDKIPYHSIKLLPGLALFSLLFGGCSSDIYSQFCTAEKVKINCFKLESLDGEVSQIMQTQFSQIDQRETCAFTLQGMRHHVDACQNPVANSVGSDFDGYVKLQVFYKGKCYYRVQTDYKGRGWQQHMEGISEQLKSDLAIN